jgi:hypothetical protein
MNNASCWKACVSSKPYPNVSSYEWSVRKEETVYLRADPKARKAVKIVALLYTQESIQRRSWPRLTGNRCMLHISGITQLPFSTTAPVHSAWQARHLDMFGRKSVWAGSTYLRLTCKSRVMHDSSPAEPASSYPVGHPSETRLSLQACRLSFSGQSRWLHPESWVPENPARLDRGL